MLMIPERLLDDFRRRLTQTSAAEFMYAVISCKVPQLRIVDWLQVSYGRAALIDQVSYSMFPSDITFSKQRGSRPSGLN